MSIAKYYNYKLSNANNERLNQLSQAFLDKILNFREIIRVSLVLPITTKLVYLEISTSSQRTHKIVELSRLALRINFAQIDRICDLLNFDIDVDATMQLSNAIINFKHQNFLKLSSIEIVFESSNFGKKKNSKNTIFAYLDSFSLSRDLTLTLDFLRELWELRKLRKLWKTIIKLSGKIKRRWNLDWPFGSNSWNRIA